MPVFSLIGGAMQASAAKKASKAQSKAAEADLAFQKEQAAKSEARLAPYVQLGTGAIPLYNDSLGLNGAAGNARAVNAFQAGPGYSFAMNEGIKARDMSAAARGGLYSGAYAKELTRYGQGVANQEYGGWQNRLMGNISLGQNAAAQTGNLGLGYANNVSNALNNQGAAQASGYIGAANAWGGALNGVAQSLGNIGERNNWFTSSKKSWGW